MKHSLLALLISSFCSIAPAFAVVGGELRDAAEVSTVEISIQHWMWTPQNPYATAAATCSSVVVGVNPLALLTASHCLRQVVVDGATKLPQVRIKHLPAGAKAELRGAIYHPFDRVNAGVVADLALLVFETEGGPEWRPVRIGAVPEHEEGYLCGYGFAKYEPRALSPRCAAKDIIHDVYDLAQYLPESYEPKDPGLYEKMQKLFRRKRNFIPPGSWVGVNRLQANQYTVDEPMPRLGDSGGPWLRRGADGKFEVFALTSFVESLVPQETSWTAAFREQQIDTLDLPYASYGVRLDTPAARAVLDHAKEIGAKLVE